MMNRRLFLSVAAASSAGLALSRADFPSDRKFRIAVIGHTGRGNYGHGEDAVWLKIPEAEVVGFADADTNGLAAEQKKLKLDKGYADYRQMLSAVKPDIVTIAPRFVDEHREMTPVKEALSWQPISTAGAGQPEPIPNLGPEVAGHVLAVRDLMAAIREDRAPLCDARAGLTTVEMICAAFESHRLGGQRVTFPLQTRKNPFTLL
jgi:predicted dehydrogenase